MMISTQKFVDMMVEIAVELKFKHPTVLSVFVINQIWKIVISRIYCGLVMDFVMMTITMQTVIMMGVTAVEKML